MYFKKILGACLAIGLLAFNMPVYATDEAVLGNNRWRVENDGDLIPQADETYDIGSSSYEVDYLYLKSGVVLNGVTYTSFATGTDGNWTNGGLTTTLDVAPTKFILTHSSGDMFATGFTVGTGDFTFANGQKLDGDTNNEIRLIENSDTLKIGFSGDDITIDCTDGGVIFALTDGTDGSVDFMTNNDTDDYIQISTSSNQPLINFVGCNGKITAASGTISFDDENLSTTGTLAAGVSTLTSIALTNGETVSNGTNGTVTVSGNAGGQILDVLDAGTSDSDASISLSADAAADNGDVWRLTSDGATNGLLIENNTSGSQATIASLSTAGVLTLTGALTLSNAEVISNATNGTIRLATNGTGDSITEIYTGNTTNGDATLLLTADADADAGDRMAIQHDGATNSMLFMSDTASADTLATIMTLSKLGVLTLTGAMTLSNGETISNAVDDTVQVESDDSHTVFSIYSSYATNGTAALNLVGDAQADATDSFQIKNNANGTLTIGNDSSAAGTYLTKLTLSSAGLLTLINSETIDNTVDNTVTIGSAASMITKLYSSNATNGTVSLQLVGDAAADATDGWQIQNPADGTLTIGNDSAVSGTYVTKLTLSSAGVLTLVDGETITNASDVVTIGADDAAASLVVSGFEGSASSITIQSDEGDDAVDKFNISMDAADLLTMTTGTTQAATVSTAGLWTLTAATVTGATLLNGATTLGDNIADITTFTGKIAGATPMSFDGNTADGVYTIFAITDPTSSSKTITFPAQTGTIMLTGAATALTAGAAVTLTVGTGNQLFTDTITTDNEDQTITFSGAGSAGDRITIIFITDTGGSGDEVITFETTLVNSEGTLTLANLTAGRYVVTFVSDGAAWNEVSRTAALS